MTHYHTIDITAAEDCHTACNLKITNIESPSAKYVGILSNQITDWMGSARDVYNLDLTKGAYNMLVTGLTYNGAPIDSITTVAIDAATNYVDVCAADYDASILADGWRQCATDEGRADDMPDGWTDVRDWQEAYEASCPAYNGSGVPDAIDALLDAATHITISAPEDDSIEPADYALPAGGEIDMVAYLEEGDNIYASELYLHVASDASEAGYWAMDNDQLPRVDADLADLLDTAAYAALPHYTANASEVDVLVVDPSAL